MTIYEQKIRRLLHWLTWPAVFIVMRGSLRTRVLVVARGKILVIRGWHAGQQWELPGGGVHRGEKIKVAAAREVYEELGISLLASSLTSLGLIEHNQRGIQFRIESFTTTLPKQVALQPSRLEVVETYWAKPSELTLEVATPDTLAIVATWKKRRNSATLKPGSKVKTR